MCCTWFVVVSVRSIWSDNESVSSHWIKSKNVTSWQKKLNSAQKKTPLHDCNGAKQKYTNEELCLHETNGAIHPIRLNSNSKCYRITFWLGWKTWCYFQLLSVNLQRAKRQPFHFSLKHINHLDWSLTPVLILLPIYCIAHGVQVVKSKYARTHFASITVAKEETKWWRQHHNPNRNWAQRNRNKCVCVCVYMYDEPPLNSINRFPFLPNHLNSSSFHFIEEVLHNFRHL